MDSDLDVRVVELAPMRVASFLGFGTEPETQAFEKLMAWAKPKGFLEAPEAHRLFGFNNPDPSAGSPNYGYEVWIEIEPDMEVEDEIKLHECPGGLYAVTRCPVPKGDFDAIGKTWKRLVAWREGSRYQCGAHQWLEQSLPDSPPDHEFVLDLFLPIRE